MDRRDFLAAALASCSAPLFAQGLPELMPASARKRRVVIVGGGWGGLSAARWLREFAPELEVVVLERNAAFWSCPLSNRWLVGLLDERHLVHDYKTAADAYGYSFIQTDVAAVDRERRRVVTSQGALAYDWLILAVGIRYDYSAWLGDDRAAVDHARKAYPCAFTPGDEARTLKAKLDSFAGGDLVMTLPPSPYRCPPAPYERAGMIAWLMKSRKIKGKLVVIDPNTILPAFARVFADQYRDQIVYVPHAAVKEFDPFRKTIATDFDEFRFDDAIVMAPQQAGDLVWQAGLVGRGADGKPTGWAAHDPVHLHAVDDERVFLIGDLMGWVSPLFGPYPKTGQIASRLGRIAAAEIAARAHGTEVPKLLPDSTCHIYTSVEPMEALRLEASYRFRGDGVIVQAGKQTADPQPRDEDVQWAKAMFGEFLAYR